MRAHWQRAVALDGGTTDALIEHRARVERERAQLGMELRDTELVFSHEDGTPIIPHLFTLSFQKEAKAAGLPRIRLHDLRHTHATLALQAGVHPKVVSERLGHASIAITLDTYSHVIPTLQETAAELVAALVLQEDERPSLDPLAA